MILPPTITEIQAAFTEAEELYPKISDRYSQLILVPHAGIHESRIVTATALAYVHPNARVLLIGTNHQNLEFPNHVSNIVDTREHSLTVNAAFLEYLEIPCTMMLLDSRADLNLIANLIVNSLVKDTLNTVVVSSDLSHYWSNQESINKLESPLIEALIKADYHRVDDILKSNDLNACGKVPLRLTARIANLMRQQGDVTCYNDSKDKRLVWSTKDGEKMVSYLGMIWIPGDVSMVSEYDLRTLVSYAKSCIWAELQRGGISDMPSWSKWYHHHNGVFVGIQDLDGDTRASIGRYESQKTCVENTREAALDCVRDAAERWDNPLYLDKFQDYTFYVNILQAKSEWTTFKPTDLIGKLSPEMDYGFYLTIEPENRSATYLPSVWRDLAKTDSFEDLMTSLTKKAGGSGDEWQNSGSTVKLYKTRLVMEK